MFRSLIASSFFVFRLFLLFFSVFLSWGLSAAQTPFRLTLSEPRRNLDPHFLRTSAGQYLNQQLYRNFYRLNENNSYVTDLGAKCDKKKTRWVCSLKKELKWSNGSPLTADDFVLSFRRILTLPAPRADLLLGLQNAQAILDKKKTPEQLGIRSLNSTDFEILWRDEFAPDDFVLMSPLLVPLPRGEYQTGVVSGPYQITSQSPTKIQMSPNPHYHLKNQRPILEWLLYEDNLTLEAFERKEIDLVRRIPTSLIPKYEKDLNYKLLNVIRLDALVFGPSLESSAEFRKDLVLSLDYLELQKLFNSQNKPGCVGLPLEFYEGPELCYNKSPQFESKTFKNLPTGYQGKKLTFAYSNLGGEDHRRLSEWLQSQWKSRLGLDVSVQGLENKVFLQNIQSKPPDVYRRGLSPENPSCYGALSVFTSNHPDNYLNFKNSEFDSLVEKLRKATSQSHSKSRKYCRQALELLMHSYQMIPTGRFGFSMLLRAGWKNIRINALNHLDLSELSNSLAK